MNKPPLALCPADSPLQFVPSGIELEPKKSTMLVGLAVASSAIQSISESVVKINLSLKSARGLGRLSVTCGA